MIASGMAESKGPSRSKRSKRVPLREQQKQVTRQRLLDAAREMFAEKGYAATTVDDITEAAGASRATFYLHFASKPDLVVALTDDLIPGALTYFEQLDEVLGAGSRSDLRDWMARAMKWFETHQAEIEAIEAMSALHPDLAPDAVSMLPDPMDRYLARWPKRQRPAARLRIQMMVMQLGELYTLSQLRQTLVADPEQAADELTDIWLDCLSVPSR